MVDGAWILQCLEKCFCLSSKNNDVSKKDLNQVCEDWVLSFTVGLQQICGKWVEREIRMNVERPVRKHSQ